MNVNFNFVRDLGKDHDFIKVLGLFLALKLILLSVGAAGQLVPLDITDRQARTGNILTNGWAQYDAAAYVDIAKNGYNQEFLGSRGNYAWYPLYPFLIFLFSFIGYWNAAFLISNISSILFVIMLYLLAREELGSKRTSRMLLYLFLFPTAYFFVAMYTESLFMLLSVSSFYFAKRKSWLLAGFFGGLLSLTRLQGIIIFFPLLYMYLNAKNRRIDLIYLFLVPLGLISLLLHHFLVTGNPFIQFETQETFQRTVVLPTTTLYNAVAFFAGSPDPIGRFYHGFNLIILAFFSYLLLKAHKLLPKEYFIYFLLSMAIPLFSGRLEAITRFYLVVFPAFMTMAVSFQKEINTPLKAACIISFSLQILFAVRHVNENISIF